MTIQKPVRLSDVCRQDRTSVKAGQRAELAYRGLESIESNTGRFNEAGLSKTPEVPLANSFRFGPEHVLYGKLRPYLNKVALAEFEGKCSTEIIPLLPSPELDRRFLAYFLRSPRTVSRISEKAAGARMPRADMDFIFSLELVLPSLTEQRRIVDLLSRADSIVRLRRDAQNKAAELIPAIFVAMFGDPATNPKGWPVVPLGESLRSVDYGSSTKASDDGNGIPLIRMGNVGYDGSLDLSNLKYAQLENAEVEKYRLSQGDILFNRTNSKELVGKTGLWGGGLDAVVASYFIRLRVKQDLLSPVYLWAFMNARHMKRVLFDTARGAIGQANINSKELRSFRIGLPPLPLQDAFKRYVDFAESIIAQQDDALDKAKATFEALLARSFTTEALV